MFSNNDKEFYSHNECIMLSDNDVTKTGITNKLQSILEKYKQSSSNSCCMSRWQVISIHKHRTPIQIVDIFKLSLIKMKP